MFPSPFSYETPDSIQGALEIISLHGDDAKLIAGGHSLIPMMKLRLVQPDILVDLAHVPGLDRIQIDGSRLVIGAMATHWQVESSETVRSNLPFVSELAGGIADPLVRNRGTIGGSLAHADPAADYPAVMLALGAEFVCATASGRRTVCAEEWFQGTMATALAEDEILVEVRLPLAGPGAAYVKCAHPASGFALVGVAALLEMDGSGTCTGARIGITGAGQTAVRAPGVERVIEGERLEDDLIEVASAAAADGIDLQGDLHCSAERRGLLCKVMTKRALTEAGRRSRAC